MVRFISIILSVLIFSGCGYVENSKSIFEILESLSSQNEEIKGVWLSYHDLASPLKKQSKEEFEKEIKIIFKNCKSIGINTLFVHIRPFGDSFYESQFFPLSGYCNGNYDALEIMTKLAKAENLSFHAWINPMRCMTVEQVVSVDKSFAVRCWYDENSDCVTEHDGRVYLNPAKAEARKLITDGVREILDNYEVDGIHIDDYFYPPNLPFEKDNSDAPKRRENTDKMVKELYETVKEHGKIFSISPTGNMDYNYNTIYSDSKKWCSQYGYCDYIIPQIYYGFENESLSFEKALSDWCKVSQVKVLVGLAAYKVGVTDKYAGKGQNEWIENDDILLRQTEKSKEYDNVTGVVYFRYGSLFS